MQSFQNAICTPFTMEGPNRRNLFFNLRPKINGFSHCRKLTNGALYEKSGHIIHDSIRKGGIHGDQVISIAPIIIDPTTQVSEIIEGNSAYLGNLYSHYGHFITEGLSRFYDFKSLNDFDHLLFSPFIFDYPKTQLRDYHNYFLEQLGIDQSKIKILYHPVKIEEVTVFKQLWTLNDSVDPELIPLYDYLRGIKPLRKIEGERIFLSRKSEDRVMNQKEIEKLFIAKGFRLVYPEEISLDEQMSIYKGPNLIVTSSGSIAHNLLFANQHTRFIELGDQRSSEKPHVNQELVNSLSVANYKFIPFESKDGKNWDLEILKRHINSF